VEELRRIRIAAVISLLLALASVHCADAEESVAQGERVYENYCATCHGEQLQNNSSGLTFDLRRLKADDYSRFANSVRNGKNKMPPWKGVLDDAQVDQVWAYIRATSPP
jgi:mono/diheme cytochrome c family protein